MIKLMIADDEPSIRRGLRRYIDWGAWNIQCVAEASDGEEAFEKACNCQPDILLTDIRMPKLDGLELARRLRIQLPQLRILMLTGYNDTQYLKSALDLGIQGYLLKPAGSEEIIKAVLKQKKEILKEQERSQHEMMLDSLMEESIPILQMHFFDDLFCGRVKSMDPVLYKANLLRIPVQGPSYLALILNLNYQDHYDYKSQYDKDIDQWHTLQELEKFSSEDHSVFYCEMEPQQYFILVNAPYGSNPRDVEESVARRMGGLLKKVEDRDPYLGVGNIVDDLLQIKESYELAKMALRMHAWDCDKAVYFCYGEDNRQTGEVPVAATEHEKKAILMLADSRWESATQEVSSMFQCYRERHADFSLVQDACRRLRAFFPAALLATEEKSCPASSNAIIDNFYSADALETWMREQILVDTGGKPTRGQYQHLIDKAIQYLQQHYSSDITLQILAKEVFMSPNYLGHIFKEQTGYKVTDWLNRYRIEQAKELLRTTDIKAYELAEIVGFSSYKYFSMYFLKYVGCSARDFRSSARDSERPASDP